MAVIQHHDAVEELAADAALCGGRTFAQDRETCAVWGMSAAAVELDAVEACLPLETIPAKLVAVATARGHGHSTGPTAVPGTRNA